MVAGSGSSPLGLFLVCRGRIRPLACQGEVPAIPAGEGRLLSPEHFRHSVSRARSGARSSSEPPLKGGNAGSFEARLAGLVFHKPVCASALFPGH